MTLLEAIQNRHSVRSYTDKTIAPDTLAALEQEIEQTNALSGLNIQLITNEPAALTGAMARYGKFSSAAARLEYLLGGFDVQQGQMQSNRPKG